MAAIAAIIVAIARSSWRDLRSLGSFTGNNLMALIASLMVGESGDRPSSTAAFYMLMGLLYLFPLAQDLAVRIPSERFQFWPLTLPQRAAIHAINLALNPLLLIAVLFAGLSRDRALGTTLFVAGAIAPFLFIGINFVLSRTKAFSGFHPFLYVPRFPGRLGGLIQNHVREFLGMLDFYFAAALAFGGFLYRILAQHPDPMAPLVLGHLTVILLGTLAQCQFGFDAEAAQMRARLLPVSGMEILLAKDIAWFSLVILLIWPFPFLPAVAATAMASAVAHHAAVEHPIEQRRWRFVQGRLAPTGIVQMFALVSAGVAVHQLGWPILPPFLAIYGVSLWWFGRKWDRSLNRN